MDAMKFGEFIAMLRKEKNMTQAELAKQLQVTDKAVSKWERGLGFPDIKLIEPLSEALEVSILEIMKSEKIEKLEIMPVEVDTVLADTFELIAQQRKAERKNMLRIFEGTAVLLLIVFVIDSMSWIGFVAACLPILGLAGSIALAIYGLWRKINKLPCLQTFTMSALLLLIPFMWFLTLFLGGAFGIGPITG